MAHLHHYNDLKLIFTTLAGPNGVVSLEILRDALTDPIIGNYLPKDCLACWKSYSTSSQDGTVMLGLEGFIKGLDDAIAADSKFAEVATKESKANKGGAKGLCTTEELEGVLMQCNQKKLATALMRSRNDLYRATSDTTGRKRDGEGPTTPSKSKPPHLQLPKAVVSQPVNESEVLILVEQMLRSKTVDERYISEVIGHLKGVTSPQPLNPSPIKQQISHPIRRSVSVKEDTKPSSVRVSYGSRPGQLPVDVDSSVTLVRSASNPGKKPSKGSRGGTKKHHHHQQDFEPHPPNPLLQTSLSVPAPHDQTMYSKSMHNLSSSTTKEQLIGWMEQQRFKGNNAPVPQQGGGAPYRTISAQQVNYPYNQPTANSIQGTIPKQKLFKSTPDVHSTSHIPSHTYTQQDLKHAEQFATLRYSKDSKHSKRKPDPATGHGSVQSPMKNECKTYKSEYIAEIHKLRSEKEALIKQLFEQQAASASSKDDSLISVL